MSLRIRAENLHVRLGGEDILRGVDLAAEPGDFVTLLGPSGSGKTTTLNVLAGFTRQHEGRVLFDGESVDDEPPQSRGVGIVFQNYALFPHMSVGENVAFPLRARGVQRAERDRRVGEALEMVGLGELGGRRVRSLSGGQQQRVALARALVFRPRLILLDEPLAALDRHLREAMQVELKRLQRQVGVTTVAVTHDQTEALTLSTRVAIMHEGRVAQCDRPEVLYRRPASLFVAGFLGEANLLTVDDDGCVPALGLRGADRGGTAVLRPEALELSAGKHARVDQVDYQGTRFRVLCRAAADPEQQIIVSAPPGTDPDLLSPGADVGLRLIDAADLHVITERTDG